MEENSSYFELSKHPHTLVFLIQRKGFLLIRIGVFCVSGVAIGAGWQAVVAYVNIACYYIFGIPLGLILGYKVNLGVKVIAPFTFKFL